MELQTSPNFVALIVGITGMAGLSIAEALKRPDSLAGPWKVYGAARRPKPSWFPSSIVDHYLTFNAKDLNDTRHKLLPVAGEITHIFWVAIQVSETESDKSVTNSLMLSNVLNLVRDNSPRLTHITLQTGTQYYMGPIHHTPSNTKLAPHDPPFHEDLPRLPYPNFYYPLEDQVANFGGSVTYSIHRSSIIIGASSRSVYNALLTLAVYAIISRHQGLRFRYPGTRFTWEHFCDMTDARVLADQHVWAAVTAKAKNEAFNCTNGEVFMWKNIWKLLCGLFDVEYEPFDESQKFDFVGVMKGKGEVWDEIVEKYGLHKTKLEEITCFAAVKTVLDFDFQHVSSMTKSREYGFFGYANTFKSIRMWVEKLRDMKIIP